MEKRTLVGTGFLISAGVGISTSLCKNRPKSPDISWRVGEFFSHWDHEELGVPSWSHLGLTSGGEGTAGNEKIFATAKQQQMKMHEEPLENQVKTPDWMHFSIILDFFHFIHVPQQSRTIILSGNLSGKSNSCREISRCAHQIPVLGF